MIDKNMPTRRKVMKKSALAGLGISSMGAVPQASASNDDVFTFSTNSRKYVEPNRLGADKWIAASSTTIEYTRTIYDPADDVYLHKFKASGSVSTQIKRTIFGWELDESIRNFSLKLLNLEPNNASLLTPNKSDRRMVGSTTSDENIDYVDGLEATIRASIASLNFYTEVAVAADSIISNLNGDNSDAGPISKDEYQGYKYKWNPTEWKLNPIHGEKEAASVSFYIESGHQLFDVQVETTMSVAPPSGPSGKSEQGNWTSKLRTTQSTVKEPINTSVVDNSSSKISTKTISRDEIEDPVVKDRLNGDKLVTYKLPVEKKRPVSNL